MKQPECLHVPSLYEGTTAQIDWSAVDLAAGYLLERTFNESFDQALAGCTWENLEGLNRTWNTCDQEDLSWAQIENRTGWGRSWERLEYDRSNWSQIEAAGLTWQQIEQQEISLEIFKGPGTEVLSSEQGRCWAELDSAGQTWSGFEASNLSWAERERITLLGLSWEGIDARWQTFAEWEGHDLTFAEFEALPGGREHRGTADAIPIGAVSAMYRIKAYDRDGGESDFLTTSQLPVIPLFYRSQALEYWVQEGRRYRLLLQAQEVSDLDRVGMTFCYPSEQLELTSFAAGDPEQVLKAGKYPRQQLEIYSTAPGKVFFQSMRKVNSEERFSGALAVVELLARKTGKAVITLS